MTIKEVAEYLRVSHYSIVKWKRSGLIRFNKRRPPANEGGHWFYDCDMGEVLIYLLHFNDDVAWDELDKKYWKQKLWNKLSEMD